MRGIRVGAVASKLPVWSRSIGYQGRDKPQPLRNTKYLPMKAIPAWTAPMVASWYRMSDKNKEQGLLGINPRSHFLSETCPPFSQARRVTHVEWRAESSSPHHRYAQQTAYQASLALATALWLAPPVASPMRVDPES